MRLYSIRYLAPPGLLAAALLLGACASVPPAIREAPAVNPGVAEVSRQPAAHLQQTVRWGGVILETENRSDLTAVTILALPLNKSGKPQDGDASPGRFIALVPSFLEPTVYSRDRKFTVTGVVTGSETRKVGEFPYRYPLIQVDNYYLWPLDPKLSDEDRYYPWGWYDPWYDPWYPLYYPHRHLH